MKKIILLLYCAIFIMTSCTPDEDIETLEPQLSPSIVNQVDFIIDDDRITIKYQKDQEGSVIPVESDDLTRLRSIYDSHPNLIMEPFSENEIRLFLNRDDLESYYGAAKNLNNVNSNSTNSNSSNPSLLRNALSRLGLYVHADYVGRLASLADPNFSSNGIVTDYSIQRRLMNFDDNSVFTWYSGVALIVQPVVAVISDYNDIISSVNMQYDPNNKVRVLLCEHQNFTGRGFNLDATAPNNTLSYSDLRYLCWGFFNQHHWNDKISSVLIYNEFQEPLNGIVSTGSGGSGGTWSGGEDEELPDVPVIVDLTN